MARKRSKSGHHHQKGPGGQGPLAGHRAKGDENILDRGGAPGRGSQTHPLRKRSYSFSEGKSNDKLEYMAGFFRRFCGFKNNRISETLSLGEKSLSLAKNPFWRKFGISFEFR